MKPESTEGREGAWEGWRGADGLATLGQGHESWCAELSLQSRPPAQARRSPSGAERLNTITREMGPSCRIVHVCRTSVGRGRTQGSAPSPRPPVPAPTPAVTLVSLVHVGNSDITILTAEGGESPGCAREVVDVKPEDAGGWAGDSGAGGCHWVLAPYSASPGASTPFLWLWDPAGESDFSEVTPTAALFL